MMSSSQERVRTHLSEHPHRLSSNLGFGRVTHAPPLSSSDKGVLHKSVVFEGEVHIVEEIQLLKNSESIKNLLLSSEVSGCTKKAQVVSKCTFFICLLFMCSLRGGVKSLQKEVGSKMP